MAQRRQHGSPSSAAQPALAPDGAAQPSSLPDGAWTIFRDVDLLRDIVDVDCGPGPNGVQWR